MWYEAFRHATIDQIGQSFVLDATLKVTLLLFFAWGATLLLQRRSAALRHWIWTISLLGAVVIPIAMLILPGWGPERTLQGPQLSSTSHSLKLRPSQLHEPESSQHSTFRPTESVTEHEPTGIQFDRTDTPVDASTLTLTPTDNSLKVADYTNIAISIRSQIRNTWTGPLTNQRPSRCKSQILLGIPLKRAWL